MENISYLTFYFNPPQKKKKSNSSRLESAKTHQWLYTDARSTMKMKWKLVTSSRRNFGLWCVNALYDLLLPLLISVRNTSNSMYRPKLLGHHWPLSRDF